MTYMGITYDDPEYKILEPIIDDDMCAIMMHVRLETNRTVEEVAKRARKSVEFTQEQLDKLCKTGAVRYRYVDGKRCYFYPIWVPGIMEGILANREQCDKYPRARRELRGVHPPPSGNARADARLRQDWYVLHARHARHERHRERLARRLLRRSAHPHRERDRHQRRSVLLPPCPPSHGRGLRPPRRGYVHVPQRQRPLLLRAGLSPPRDQGRGI